ncbi:stretch-activated Ca2+-permeable channel component-domain-containing protein [Xylaria nigripes]|nr:stretch-activated Ca2+-permeable channel component-domain-containing protein [Xylaria nigripes]
MQLSPLQSRLAASAVASCLLIILYVLLFAPRYASAAELVETPIGINSDDSHTSEGVGNSPVDLAHSYEPDFFLFDRSMIGRVSEVTIPVLVDTLYKSNIQSGSTIVYMVDLASVSGRSAQPPGTPFELWRRLDGAQNVVGDEGNGVNELKLDVGKASRDGSSKTLYISANTCNQPDRISPDQITVDPPQLTLFVSTSRENTSPGPGKGQDTQETIVFDEGAVMFNISLEHDVYFSISAPQFSDKDFAASSPYNYEMKASLDGYHYAYDAENGPNLYWVDSDASSALLTTRSLSSDLQQTISTPPYQVFVQNAGNLGINGIRKSYCGLSQYAQIRPLHEGAGQITIDLRRGVDNLTMEEFYLSGLNASTNYTGIIVDTSSNLQKRQDGGTNSGIIVFDGVEFSTKPNGACTLITNLTVCTETRYAVPGNATNFPNATALAAFYDDYTRAMWDSFDKVLQQTPCEAPSTQRYSLVRNCDDCKQAYKRWLCSVAIPRCEDFSSPEHPSLQMRNINAPFPDGSLVSEGIREYYGKRLAFNSSRNPAIDTMIQPGPYKEVLPCDFLCNELVQSCPASMGFSCPLPSSKYGFETSYAIPNASSELSCNYPGSAHFPTPVGAANAMSMSMSWMAVAIPIILSFLLRW